MYRDYRDEVNFFYVYKTVEHHGINGFVEPFTIEERLKHIAVAKERLRTEIPWLCDSMDNEVKKYFGKAPNGEFVISPEGRVIRKRFWSSAETLRADLEELVGKSSTFTKPTDVETGFQVETVSNEKIASGVVPEIELPTGLKALRIEAGESDQPFFAKLRVEATPRITRGGGKLHFLLTLDPIYKMHWNNLAGKVRIELSSTKDLKLSNDILESEALEVDADIDPRRFLIDLKSAKVKRGSTFTAKVIYHVCDDAETVCMDVEQEYQILLKFNRDGGTRPGIFMVSMLQDIPGWDENEDGVITKDELPSRNAQLIMNHLDYSGNGVVEREEVERFTNMFNNGKGIGRPDGLKDDAEEDGAELEGTEKEDGSSEEGGEAEVGEEESGEEENGEEESDEGGEEESR